MSDPDKTDRIKTIPRCKPRDPWEETTKALAVAQSYAPASSIREAIEQLLIEMQRRGEQHESLVDERDWTGDDRRSNNNIRRAVGG